MIPRNNTARDRDDDQDNQADFCRVCRCEAGPGRPLFYPCLCTGSIKYVHQDCLVQWLKYSKREYCELCKHKITFTPIYSPDMPKRLPYRVILTGVGSSVLRAVTCWLHYTLVALAWLGVVPLTACRIYRCLFTGSFTSLLTLPVDMLSTDNLLSDCLQGIVVVLATLAAFIGYIWLREQIVQGGGPDWLEPEQNQQARDAGLGQPAEPAQPGHPWPGNWLAGGLFNVLAGVGGGAEMVGAGQMQDANAGQVGVNEVAVGDDNDGEEEQDEGGQGPAPGPHENDGAAAGPGVAAAPPDLVPAAGAVEQDWERAADELTWERLLGLDGSLVFLEHVFWVVSLNTLFILVFAFCPYHIGHFAIAGMNLESAVATTQMAGLVTTLLGYVILALMLVLLHFMLQLGRVNKARHLAGLGYLVIKVALLGVLEVGLFPISCGVWIDICSLGIFNATLTQRSSLFQYAPVTFAFMHWTVGMMYIFYFASFLLLLKEVVRSGVFWFLRNFNDPDFNPVQDMIVQPVHRHMRRFILNCTVFGTIIFLMLWLPISIMKACLSNFLPYHFSVAHDSPLDYSVEIFFLQMILPILFDSHAKFWLKAGVRLWCTGAAWLLDLRSYLLGDQVVKLGDVIVHADGQQFRIVQTPNENGTPQDLPDIGAAVGHDAAAGPHHHEQDTFRPYIRPPYFSLRIAALLICICSSLVVTSLLLLTLPIQLGRRLLHVMDLGTKHDLFALITGLTSIGVSLKLCYCLPRAVREGGRLAGGTAAAAAVSVGPPGIGLLRRIGRKLHYVVVGARLVLLSGLFLGLVPAALGLLVNLVFITPFRVPPAKTLVIGFWEHWIFGIMHLKVWVLLVLVGPRWWMRDRLERIQEEVMRREALHPALLLHHAAPLLAGLSGSLAGPYVAAHSLAPMLGFDCDIVFRNIYPIVFAVLLVIGLFCFQLRQFRRLYDTIKDSKYLVGQRLVNYDHSRRAASSAH